MNLVVIIVEGTGMGHREQKNSLGTQAAFRGLSAEGRPEAWSGWSQVQEQVDKPGLELPS